MIESPPPELAELFADESAARPILDRGTRTAVRAKLASSIGSAALGAGGTLAVAGKVIAVLAVTVGLGTWFATTHRDPDVQASSSSERVTTPLSADVAPAPSSPSAPVEAPVEPARVEADPLATDPAPQHRAHTIRPSSVRAVEQPATEAAPIEAMPAPTPSQATLLREAWTSLAAGNADHALALAVRDRALHPDGELVEERDALEIQALAKTGRSSEARAAATRFLTSYPTSIHRARIDRAIEENP